MIYLYRAMGRLLQEQSLAKLTTKDPAIKVDDQLSGTIWQQI
jgi:hypothetical protein